MVGTAHSLAHTPGTARQNGRVGIRMAASRETMGEIGGVGR